MKYKILPPAPASYSPEYRPTHVEIATTAHSLWQQKNCPHDRDEEIWLEAERTLLSGSGRPTFSQVSQETSREIVSDTDKLEAWLDDMDEPAVRRSATSL